MAVPSKVECDVLAFFRISENKPVACSIHDDWSTGVCGSATGRWQIPTTKGGVPEPLLTVLRRAWWVTGWLANGRHFSRRILAECRCTQQEGQQNGPFHLRFASFLDL